MNYYGLAAFDPHLELPMTWQWNAAIERQLSPHQALSLSYVGAYGQRLSRPDLIVPLGSGLAGNAVVSATWNAGTSYYNALQAQLRRQMSRGRKECYRGVEELRGEVWLWI